MNVMETVLRKKIDPYLSLENLSAILPPGCATVLQARGKKLSQDNLIGMILFFPGFSAQTVKLEKHHFNHQRSSRHHSADQLRPHRFPGP